MKNENAVVRHRQIYLLESGKVLNDKEISYQAILPKLCVSGVLHDSSMIAVTEGHFGVNRTLARIRDEYLGELAE